ncbi:MAG: M23 family metallopeptidase [Ruminococcus sp.]|nr:M23 family metallopeptidase [Ruminococcus sp.]
MSKVSETIFHGAKHTLSSPFGNRSVIKTSAGNTGSFHSGCDYSTSGKKLPQYPILDGVVTSCGQDTAANGCANFVWVEYAQLGYRLMHYHLDSISVKKGQKVTVSTELGKTGKSGKATGIHLHLGVKKIGGTEWIDPEKWSKDVFEKYLKEQEEAKKKPAEKKYTKGNYRVSTAEVLNVRTGPSTKYTRKAFCQLTADARKKILKLTNNVKKNGYVKGLAFSVTEVKNNWGKTPSGWVCLDYCVKI